MVYRSPSQTSRLLYPEVIIYKNLNSSLECENIFHHLISTPTCFPGLAQSRYVLTYEETDLPMTFYQILFRKRQQNLEVTQIFLNFLSLLISNQSVICCSSTIASMIFARMHHQLIKSNGLKLLNFVVHSFLKCQDYRTYQPQMFPALSQISRVNKSPRYSVVYLVMKKKDHLITLLRIRTSTNRDSPVSAIC